MSQQHDREAQERERQDPGEQSNPLPRFMAVVSVLFVIWGFGYFFLNTGFPVDAGDQRSARVPASASDEVSGATVYAGNCASCHQGNGRGVSGAFPPLAASRWVTGDAALPVQILLHGVDGEIEVAGETYNGVMPAFGKQLSDAEIAAVVSYIRNDWGNDSPPVDGSFVREQRDRFPAGRGAWNGGDGLRANVAQP